MQTTNQRKPFAAPQAALNLFNSARLQNLLHKVEQLNLIKTWLTLHLAPELAQRCYPASFTPSALTINVDSAAWATQLRFQLPQLLTGLQHYPLLATITQIHLKVRPAKKVIDLAYWPPAQVKPATGDLLTMTASTVQNEKLQQALLKLATTIKSKN